MRTTITTFTKTIGPALTGNHSANNTYSHSYGSSD